MHDEQMCFEAELALIDGSLRGGDHQRASAHLAVFDAKLTRYVRGEELVLFPVLERFASIPIETTDKLRHEHGSLRRLVDMLWELIARKDQPRGLEVLGVLRSVLLVHVTKEAWMLDYQR